MPPGTRNLVILTHIFYESVSPYTLSVVLKGVLKTPKRKRPIPLLLNSEKKRGKIHFFIIIIIELFRTLDSLFSENHAAIEPFTSNRQAPGISTSDRSSQDHTWVIKGSKMAKDRYLTSSLIDPRLIELSCWVKHTWGLMYSDPHWGRSLDNAKAAKRMLCMKLRRWHFEVKGTRVSYHRRIHKPGSVHVYLILVN